MANAATTLEGGTGVSDAEIETVIAPYVKRRLATGDAEWRDWQRKTDRTWALARLRRQCLGWLPGGRRDQGTVRRIYDQNWSHDDLTRDTASDDGTPMRWRDACYIAEGRALKRLYLLILMRQVFRLDPDSVLEVGCGNGRNLFTLATRLPGRRYEGVELTAAGVDAARALQDLPRIPPSLAAFSPEPPVDPEAHRSIRFQQGDAGDLPFADNSVEMAVTVLALEQMEALRDRALAELARVSRGYVAMIEPFRDWNERGARRNRIVALDYFSARVSDLPRFGFEVLVHSGDMPSKMRMGVGFVLARAPNG